MDGGGAVEREGRSVVSRVKLLTRRQRLLAHIGTLNHVSMVPRNLGTGRGRWMDSRIPHESTKAWKRTRNQHPQDAAEYHDAAEHAEHQTECFYRYVAASTCQKRRSSLSLWRSMLEDPTASHRRILDDVWRRPQATKDRDSRHLNRSAASPACSIGRLHRRLRTCSFGLFACSAWSSTLRRRQLRRTRGRRLHG